jgi:hypothetical protein
MLREAAQAFGDLAERLNLRLQRAASADSPPVKKRH